MRPKPKESQSKCNLKPGESQKERNLTKWMSLIGCETSQI